MATKMAGENTTPSRPDIRTGIDVLLDDESDRLANRRVGLLVNATSVDRTLTPSIQRIHDLSPVTLAAIFAPEHGYFGVAQDMESVDSHRWNGIVVHSLYGATEDSLRPRPEWLEGLDAVIYDIQDVGSRYYTYLATLGHMMAAAEAAGVEVIVCDRPNPIDGVTTEGPIVRSAFRSFVGQYPLATRHGLTTAEVARFIQSTAHPGCRLTCMPLKGWRRSMWFDQTGLPWVLPSPNMPTLDTATVYPGGCLFEGTNISEGRGTTRPFELVGAPWIVGEDLVAALGQDSLPGVAFRAVAFTPKHQKWRDQTCQGIQIHVTDREAFKPLLTAVAILKAIARLYPRSFEWRHEAYEFVKDRLAIDLLAGNDELRGQIERDDPLHVIESGWAEELAAFREARAAVLMYE